MSAAKPRTRNLYTRARVIFGAVQARIGEDLGVSQARVTQLLKQCPPFEADSILTHFEAPLGERVVLLALRVTQAEKIPDELKPYEYLRWINAHTVRDLRQRCLRHNLDPDNIEHALAASLLFFLEIGLAQWPST